MTPLSLAAYGLVGAFGIQAVVVMRRAAERGFFRRQFLMLIFNVVISGIVTAAYFVFFDSPPSSAFVVGNYGLFIALVVQEIEDSLSTGTRTPIPTAYSVMAAATPLILNGFFPVFGVGAFGATAAEAYSFYRERKKKIELPSTYWIIAIVLILCGGGVTVLHGIENVSALVAFQLGASPPLVYKQVKNR